MVTTVLVVDDDEGLQDTLRYLLESEGYEVVVAGDGVEALDALKRITPAVILLDVMMPRMDGYEFAREAQRRGLHPSIPIVVLTAGGRAQQKAEAMGVEAGLSKPFDIEILLALVERLSKHPDPKRDSFDAESHQHPSG